MLSSSSDSFINDLNAAICCIIDQTEKEKLPRHLILGKDACIKIDSEINCLKRDLKLAKINAKICSKYDKEFTKKVINKILRILKEKILKYKS